MTAIELENRYSAHNYEPLPVVLTRGRAAHLWDTSGRRYIDMMSAYSAVSVGHAHPRILATLSEQAHRLAVPSRAYYNDRLNPFLEALCKLTGLDAALPMNSGAEAVETAIKAARRWGQQVKGVASPEIIVAKGNFHGRTTTVISFSSEEEYRDGFGPFTPGFRLVPFGDLEATRAAVSERTVAVLVEPIQGEAGVIMPPPGFLAGLRQLCTGHGILMIADEIQSGLGRTGDTFACSAEGVVPDAYLLGKALGGGIVPVSAMVSTWPVLGVLQPGQHGSTFGGNPLACAVAREVIAMLRSGEYQAHSALLGRRMHERLAALPGGAVRAVRGRGLWAGLEFAALSGREVCERLAARGVLAKETHGTMIRLAPPLVISQDDLDWGLDRIEDVLL